MAVLLAGCAGLMAQASGLLFCMTRECSATPPKQVTCHHSMLRRDNVLASLPSASCNGSSPCRGSTVSPARRVLFIGAVLCVAGAAVTLGRWQLRRLAARRASNAVLLAARARPPLELPADLRAGTPIDSGRRGVAHGRVDPRDQLILRGRA